ncbi:glycosyltransferase [Bacillus sp. 165]|uniref:glycosyltransferase n=1 Tax=Bacillus sp. 165 TaxID=1529117 RepID=UPI001ADA5308|nr:glycosyltransferase [Bacillus sp. 165]MBO9130043.1 glycosyltransferase [Bacillus sp. 165]
MKKLFLRFSLVAMLFVCLAAPVKADVQNQCYSSSKVKVMFDLRKLWIDHVVWTRNYIISSVGGLDDQQAVLARLLKNQEDIGNAMKPYYGVAAGDKLTQLLKEHILVAGKIVEAAKKGDQANLEKYNKEWYKNADDIANLLSSVNPNWSNTELKELLYTHLKMVTDEAVARIKQDWQGNIIAFDKGEDHIIVLADALTKGIVKQFPNKFK